jgi:formylglycine-generating enzyme required for sulfatase activity
VASRAGTRTPFGFGSEVSLLARFGWFAHNSGRHGHLPRELRPSIRGVFDLIGNQFEWTHDWYGDYGETAALDSLGAKEGSYRVLRGGGWDQDAASCRSARRNGDVPTSRTFFTGFRLALSLSEVTPEAASFNGAEPSGVGTQGASAEQRPEMP